MTPYIIPDSCVQRPTPHPYQTSQNQDVQNRILNLLPDTYCMHSLLDCCAFPVSQIPDLEITLDVTSAYPAQGLIFWLNYQSISRTPLLLNTSIPAPLVQATIILCLGHCSCLPTILPVSNLPQLPSLTSARESPFQHRSVPAVLLKTLWLAQRQT